jgi:Protein of unknown function (DUF2782)
MRLPLAALLLAVSFAAAAQSTARSRPAGTVPLDEVPPPPPITQAASPEDEVVASRRTDANGQVTEEYRARGKLYMQKVTPRHGRSYVLMDHKGDGSFTKLDNSIDGHLSVPQWVLMEF